MAKVVFRLRGPVMRLDGLDLDALLSKSKWTPFRLRSFIRVQAVQSYRSCRRELETQGRDVKILRQTDSTRRMERLVTVAYETLTPLT
jgi:hypothetical protein